MNPQSYEAAALFEHRFWLQVLGDHARFILNALAPEESQEIGRATYFIQTFDMLLDQARGELSYNQLIGLTQIALQKTQELRVFKLHLLERHLVGGIKINLTPTFINHLVNELEEYLRILCALQAGKLPPVFDAVHHHLVWLLDATGHSAAIASSLDIVEKRLIEMGHLFQQHFQDFYMKAVEMAGYLRTHLRQFPALSRFNKQVELEMLLFMEFLRELEEMDLKLETLGTMSALVADHMAREECYYLTKLSLVSNVDRPECDPGKPRTEA